MAQFLPHVCSADFSPLFSRPPGRTTYSLGGYAHRFGLVWHRPINNGSPHPHVTALRPAGRYDALTTQSALFWASGCRASVTRFKCNFPWKGSPEAVSPGRFLVAFITAFRAAGFPAFAGFPLTMFAVCQDVQSFQFP